MTPDDRTLAREALIRNQLTIEQVTELQKACEASGRSFAHTAIERSLLSPDEVASILGPPPAPTSPVFHGLLVATLVVLVLIVVVAVLHQLRRVRTDNRLAEESIEARTRAEQQAREAAIAYQRSRIANRELDAQRALEKARGVMKFAEERIREAPAEPQLHSHLVEATIGFNTFLQEHPDDAAVLVERSRAYELRRDFERSLADLDRAIEIQKDLAPKLDVKVQELRLQVARPKK